MHHISINLPSPHPSKALSIITTPTSLTNNNPHITMGCFDSKPKMQKTNFWKRTHPGPSRSALLPAPCTRTQQMQLEACLWDRDFDELMTEMKRLELWDYLSYIGNWQAMKTEMKLSMLRRGDKAAALHWAELEREGEVREHRRKAVHERMARDAEGVLRRAAERRAAQRAWEEHCDGVRAKEREKVRLMRMAEEWARKRRSAEALVKAKKLRDAEAKKAEALRKRDEEVARKSSALLVEALAQRHCQLNVG